jgi:hypothetical protein
MTTRCQDGLSPAGRLPTHGALHGRRDGSPISPRERRRESDNGRKWRAASGKAVSCTKRARNSWMKVTARAGLSRAMKSPISWMSISARRLKRNRITSRRT